ncbi:DNA-directed RNA polymerase III subunit RPC2 [Cucumispora dikerogammari]|nr:DNA-directed RNA polymerase III subunit RPC2 [Cucumispora dikerogammari]
MLEKKAGTFSPEKNQTELSIIQSFFEENSFTRQQLTSFNSFIEKTIPLILNENNTLLSEMDQEFYLKYSNVKVIKPIQNISMKISNLYPTECRIRNLTYASPIFVDIEYKAYGKIVKKKNVLLGKIPTMLKSSICHIPGDSNGIKSTYELKECEKDMGGYFIIKGNEKAILIQEQLAKNRIIKEDENTVSVTSSTLNRKSKTSLILNKKMVYLKNASFSDKILLPIILTAMEFPLKESENICKQLSFSIVEMYKSGIKNTNDALKYLLKYVREDVFNALSGNVLPNVLIDNLNFYRRGFYLSFMCQKLFEDEGSILKKDDSNNDNDFLGNKRYELSGSLLELLFEDTLKNHNFNIKKQIDRLLSRTKSTLFDPLNIFQLQSHTFLNTFERAIQNGSWNLKRFKMNRAGITETVSRQSYMASVGIIGRVTSQFEKTRKIAGPRALHVSSWGFLCPIDTPEGESCGLVKNLSLLAEVSTDYNLEEQYLIKKGMIELLNMKYSEDMCLVMLNGSIVGVSYDVCGLAESIRKDRRLNLIDKYVSVSINGKTLSVSCDGGRICRPLISLDTFRKRNTVLDNTAVFKNVDNNKGIIEKIKHLLRSFTFSDLVKLGLIEYVDPNESLNLLVALYEKDITSKHTHLELDPASILGYTASLIPFPDHNQSPRNTYQCAMGKQAISLPFYNKKYRYDIHNILTYVQAPMVSNKIQSMPSGCNAMVAVLAFSGYDIEDAIIVNKASIDRGMWRVECFRSESVELDKNCDILIDLHTHNKNAKDNKKTEPDDGILAPSSIINPRQRLINKHTFIDPTVTKTQLNKETLEKIKRENQLKFTGCTFDLQDPGYVDSVVLTNSSTDKLLIKSKFRQTRNLEIGDKLSSRHGQKGVVGKIVDEQDMPFSSAGSPDLIMNPHGFPSRMTVGKILECVWGKVGVLEGRFSDGSVFSKTASYSPDWTSKEDVAGTFDSQISDDKTGVSESRVNNDAIGTNTYSEIHAGLEAHGFAFSGKDIFIDPQTGALLNSYVFYGPIYYQRLKHMVADKMHARSRGKRTALTRQPTEGRSRDGGLRFGEMERDCLVSYGVSQVLRERLLISSDFYRVRVCVSCGVFVSKGQLCGMCLGVNYRTIEVPYAFKVLIQEMAAMGVFAKMNIL